MFYACKISKIMLQVYSSRELSSLFVGYEYLRTARHRFSIIKDEEKINMDILERACNLKLYKFVNHDNSQVNVFHQPCLLFRQFSLLSIIFLFLFYFFYIKWSKKSNKNTGRADRASAAQTVDVSSISCQVKPENWYPQLSCLTLALKGTVQSFRRVWYIVGQVTT